jgi:membrane protease YdiL (CAAX protease family)
MNVEPESTDGPPPSERPTEPLRGHPLTTFFFGPDGLRVGWRLAIAILLWFIFAGILSWLVMWIPGVHAILRSRGAIVLTPTTVLESEGILAAAALLTGLVMSRIERRSFADYGLPGRAAFGKRFWQGAIYGFAMISLLMGLIAVLHGFSVNGILVRGLEAARFAFLYFLGFIAVAIFEEFSFRGYLQSTLQLAAGFWPAAAILAVIFGAIHLGNRGEAAFGAVMAGCFGLLAAFTLRRTGTIWFAIGLHALWDWGETYFYSVRDSGTAATGSLLRSDFHGPSWLTGGSVGPEGSAIVFVVLVIAAVGIHFLLPARTQAS